jgi:hypothetical protein
MSVVAPQRLTPRSSSFSHLKEPPVVSQPGFPVLFDTKTYVATLERGCQAMWDVYAAGVNKSSPVILPSHAVFLDQRAHIIVGASVGV